MSSVLLEEEARLLHWEVDWAMGEHTSVLPLELEEEMCLLRWEVTRLQWERWPGRRVGPVSGSDGVEGVGSLLRSEPG